MKTKYSKIKVWATDASTKLKKIAEGTMPDAPITTRAKVIAMRRSIMALRPDYTWDAISKMLADPQIDIKVSASTLRRLMSTPRRSA